MSINTNPTQTIKIKADLHGDKTPENIAVTFDMATGDLLRVTVNGTELQDQTSKATDIVNYDGDGVYALNANYDLKGDFDKIFIQPYGVADASEFCPDAAGIKLTAHTDGKLPERLNGARNRNAPFSIFGVGPVCD